MELLVVVMFLGFFALSIASVVFWILKIVEVVRIPEPQFQAAGTEKVTWILVVALAGAIGGLVWHFAKRPAVLDAAGGLPRPTPGWYPEPGSGTLRWWDGAAWTEHRHAPPVA